MATPTSQPPPPPPPPPPPFAAQTGGKRVRRAIGYVISITLLVLTLIPRFFSEGDDGDDSIAYRSGRVLGALLMSVAVAYFIWWFVRKARDRSGTKWSPSIFFIAVVVSVVTFVPTAVERINAAAEAEAELGFPYEETAEAHFVEPPGYRYRDPGPKAQETVERQIAADPAAADEVADVAVRDVLRDSTRVGVVVIFSIEGPPEIWEATHQGYVRGFEGSSNVDLRPTTIDGFDAAAASTAEGEFITIFDRNLVIQIVARSRDIVRDIAEGQTAAFAE